MATQVALRKKVQPSLIWLEGKYTDKVTPLSESVVIGRDAAACDVLLDDDAASRRHARIMTDPEGKAFLTDLGSSNGTFVNGEPVARVQLAEGDRLGFGSRDDVHCVFRAVPVHREEFAAVDASEAATAALSGELGHCPFCRRLITSDLGMCKYCSSMPTQSNLHEAAGAVGVAGASPAPCGACGAPARGWGAFCHRCGAKLPGR